MMVKRNYGIDLFRCFCMFLVCMLHVLGQGGILESSTGNGLNYAIFLFINIIAEVSVDGFALISGYTAIDRKQKYEKLVEMWFQVFFYSFILSLVFILFGIHGSRTIVDIIKYAFPLIFRKFWYFNAYFILFLSIPLLNKFLFSVEEENAKKTLVIIFILFTGIGLISDSFTTDYGYSPIWLIILYCVGALMKKVHFFENKKTRTLILYWLGCMGITWIITLVIHARKLINYTSPTILLGAVVLLVLFSRIQIKGKYLKRITPLVFGVYLFQLNGIIYNDLLTNSLSFVGDHNVLLGVLEVILFSLALFIVGIIVDWIRSKLFDYINISQLSKKIVVKIDFLIMKASLLLN